MKRMLFSMCAILVLSMLASSLVIAEPTHPNEVGLYLTEDGTGPTGTFETENPFFAYLVLTKPADTESGLPISTINAFECQLNFNPAGTLFMLSHGPPGDNVNLGGFDGPYISYSEYIVDFSTDLLVTAESVVLVSFLFLKGGPVEVEVTLNPISRFGSPIIPGQMSYQSGNGHLEIMHPISGSHDAPIFIFNGEAVAVETESFGTVKALYR